MQHGNTLTALYSVSDAIRRRTDASLVANALETVFLPNYSIRCQNGAIIEVQTADNYTFTLCNKQSGMEIRNGELVINGWVTIEHADVRKMKATLEMKDGFIQQGRIERFGHLYEGIFYPDIRIDHQKK